MLSESMALMSLVPSWKAGQKEAENTDFRVAQLGFKACSLSHCSMYGSL